MPGKRGSFRPHIAPEAQLDSSFAHRARQGSPPPNNPSLGQPQGCGTRQTKIIDGRHPGDSAVSMFAGRVRIGSEEIGASGDAPRHKHLITGRPSSIISVELVWGRRAAPLINQGPAQ